MLRFGELALIALIVMIIFGAGKLPGVLGDLGKGMKAFKDGMKEPETPTPPIVKKEDTTLPPDA
jgi:sec-independent protein translocase protein TatA